MSFRYDISERLSREHNDVKRLLRRFGSFLSALRAESDPDSPDADTRQLMADLRSAFESEIPNHFAIEEEDLFPMLSEQGAGGMVNMLLEEHRSILGLIREVAPIVSRAAEENVFIEDDRQTLLEKGEALVFELSAHAEKEDCGFIPAIEQLLDCESAESVFRRYQGM